MPVERIVSVSGGKDSAATAILAIEDAAAKGGGVRLVMADTGNEHPITMEYVSVTLPEALGRPIKIVKANFARQLARKREYIDTHWRAQGVPDDVCNRAISMCQPTGNPFLDLCIWKGRFPSRMAQFCTIELKRRLLDHEMLTALALGPVERWSGERRDESRRRRDYPERETAAEGWAIVRPVVHWTAKQVVDFCRDHGVPLNPLYKQGFRRVGCAPCINSSKSDIRNWSERHPEVIARIRLWEGAVSMASKRRESTFITDCNGNHGIDEVVRWSRTSFGGRQHIMQFEEPHGCASDYGLCE